MGTDDVHFGKFPLCRRTWKYSEDYKHWTKKHTVEEPSSALGESVEQFGSA